MKWDNPLTDDEEMDEDTETTHQVDDDIFHDSLDKMSDKERYGHAVHLDTDRSKGIFVRSLQLNVILRNTSTDELLGRNMRTLTKPKGDFFRQLLEQSE